MTLVQAYDDPSASLQWPLCKPAMTLVQAYNDPCEQAYNDPDALLE